MHMSLMALYGDAVAVLTTPQRTRSRSLLRRSRRPLRTTGVVDLARCLVRSATIHAAADLAAFGSHALPPLLP